MNKRKVTSLLYRLRKHAAATCARHTGRDGCHVTVHGKCVYSFDADRPTANVCPYFMRAVGPADPELFAEYLDYFPDDYPLKPERLPDDAPRCAECGKPFEKRSNRQKYCGDCREKVRREKKRKYEKERRLKASLYRGHLDE